MNRRALLGISAALIVVAVLLAVSGGFRTTVGGLRISARSPLPIAFLAFINFTVWLSAARRAQAIESDLAAAWHGVERHSTRIIVATALVSSLVVTVFSTRSASGADASGYLSQAVAWIDPPLPPVHVELIAQDLPGLEGWLTTPLGWRPADPMDLEPAGFQVPTYPPGLPLLMALPHAMAGINGATFVVIASAAMAILATGFLATHLAGRIAGLIAATLLAFTPVFLYQSIQPMSDVPVTAAWMVCFLLLSLKSATMDWLAGAACAIAVVIRPNLAPLAIVPLLFAQGKIAFSIPVAIAGLFLAVVQTMWYGSPLRSGYGTADELFALSNVLPNALRYSKWWFATAPALLVAVFGAWRLRSNRTAQAVLAFATLVVFAYLIYAVFEDWSYLRFLLPALAVFAVFAAAGLSGWIERRPIAVRAPLLLAVVLAVTAQAVWVARSVDTFKLADQLGRVSRVGDFINRNVPASAVILSGEQSGSMRYYTNRSILRWEAATAESLGKAVATLEQSGRPVYVVLDAWEDEPFRKKLAAHPAAALDWPPILEAGRSHRTRLWKLGDRDRFLRGEPMNIIRLP